MRVFSPVNVFIFRSPARCIEETVSEIVNAGTSAYRDFGYYFSDYFRYYFWYR
jgi:hypothetical protein